MSCTQRGVRELSFCGDQTWVRTHQLPSPRLLKRRIPAGARSSPRSQEREWCSEQALASCRKPLGELCLVLHWRSSSRRWICKPLRVHFAGGAARCPGLVGCQSPATSVHRTANTSPMSRWWHGGGKITKAQLLTGISVPNRSK